MSQLLLLRRKQRDAKQPEVMLFCFKPGIQIVCFQT